MCRPLRCTIASTIGVWHMRGLRIQASVPVCKRKSFTCELLIRPRFRHFIRRHEHIEVECRVTRCLELSSCCWHRRESRKRNSVIEPGVVCQIEQRTQCLAVLLCHSDSDRSFRMRLQACLMAVKARKVHACHAPTIESLPHCSSTSAVDPGARMSTDE